MITSKFNKKQNIYIQKNKKAQRKNYYYSKISLSKYHSDIKLWSHLGAFKTITKKKKKRRFKKKNQKPWRLVKASQEPFLTSTLRSWNRNSMSIIVGQQTRKWLGGKSCSPLPGLSPWLLSSLAEACPGTPVFPPLYITGQLSQNYCRTETKLSKRKDKGKNGIAVNRI